MPAAVIDLARSAATAEAGDERLIGEQVDVVAEDAVARTVRFAALDPGYRGWHWSVTLALLPDEPATVSEVVLLPGSDALIAPPWLPWDQRLRPGDLGPTDLLPAAEDDPRLVPGYLQSDDPAVEALATEIGLGRERVLSREGRDDAAERWHDGPFGPTSPTAKAAPALCGTCGFYAPLAGSLGGAFGVCANEFSPADARVVDVAFGCGAHSEVPAPPPAVPVGETALDEVTLEVHPRPSGSAVDPGIALPDAEVAAPETEVAVPEAETFLPAVETALPNAEVAVPDAETALPDAEIALPDAEVAAPDAEVAAADLEVTVPDVETTAPDVGAAGPDAETSLPDADPAGAAGEPESSGTRPVEE